MYAWSNGTGYFEGNKITQFSSDKEEEFSFNLGYKDPPKKVYIKNDCVIALMSDGKVFKKGNFIFEDPVGPSAAKEITEITFPQLESIQKIKFGSSHLLFLSSKGHVYSMGNNYYGQLGINNMMISVIFKPQQLKVGNIALNCKSIYAYKNNSFAIDKNSQLYIWGKNDYLMGMYKSNLFHPSLFLGEFKVESIKSSGGRMIIYAHREEDEINQVPLSENRTIKGESEKEEEEEQKEKEAKDKISEEKIKRTKELNKKKYKIDFQHSIAHMNNFIKKLFDDKEILENIRLYSLNVDNYSFLKTEQIQKTWDQLGSLIKTAIEDKPDSFVSQYIKIPNSKRLDLFSYLLGINIMQFYENIKLPNLQETLSDQDRDCKAIIKALIRPTENEKEKLFLDNLDQLLTAALNYKCLENFIHQLSVHQSLIKIFDINKLIKILKQTIFNNLSEVETKCYLIEKIYENILMIRGNYTSTMQNMNAFYMNKKGVLNEIEKATYEFIINVNDNIKDLWTYYIFHSKEEAILSLKKKQMTFLLEVFKKIYKIQNTGDLEYKKQNEKFGEDEKEWKENVMISMQRFENQEKELLNCVKENVKRNSEIMIKQMVTNYASAVLEEIKYKKLFLSLLTSSKRKYNLP